MDNLRHVHAAVRAQPLCLAGCVPDAAWHHLSRRAAVSADQFCDPAGHYLRAGDLDGADRRGGIGLFEGAKANSREVAYRAGVRHVGIEEATALEGQTHRTLYRFDVRASEEYAAGHIPDFGHYAGGQLIQEIDMAAPVRGARILLTDNMGVRADMTASWLAQMGWETYVLDGGYDRALEVGPPELLPKPDPSHRYRRPYEGTDVAANAMQAYLDWEYGLVEQLRRDATHGFYVI